MGSNPATLATAVLGPAAILVAPSVYQAEEAHKAKKEMRSQADRQAEQFRQAQKDLASRTSEAATRESETTARRMARRRQLALSTAGQSRQDTILTQPLGSVGQPSTQQNTLLGA